MRAKFRAYVWAAWLCPLRGKRGLEIGGPSAIFAGDGLLPLYPSVGGLDNCVFSVKTLWFETVAGEGVYCFDAGKPGGRQYIGEADALKDIRDNAYDFIVASHVLEHLANPLKAVREWQRVVRPGGVILIVVPDRNNRFDCERPVTTFAHLTEDRVRDAGEDDLTHLEEVLRCNVRSNARAESDLRCNLQTRCLHHHVFDEKLLVQVMEYLGMPVLRSRKAGAGHIFIMGSKSAPGAREGSCA